MSLGGMGVVESSTRYSTNAVILAFQGLAQASRGTLSLVHSSESELVLDVATLPFLKLPDFGPLDRGLSALGVAGPRSAAAVSRFDRFRLEYRLTVLERPGGLRIVNEPAVAYCQSIPKVRAWIAYLSYI